MYIFYFYFYTITCQCRENDETVGIGKIDERVIISYNKYDFQCNCSISKIL